MRKTTLLTLTFSLFAVSAMANQVTGQEVQIRKRIVTSTGANPIVLGEFDRDVEITSIPEEVLSFFQFFSGVETTDDNAFINFSSNSENDSIGPLLGKIMFDQGTPYNDQCPVINGGKAVTGCVATAMAQVMKYWQYPQSGKGEAIYTSSNGAKTYKFEEHPFDWNNILDTYTFSKLGNPNYNSTEATAISTLMLACGASVNMDYNYTGSGSYISRAYLALRDIFKFSPDIRYFESDNPNWEDWTESLQEEFDNGRPVIYGGTSTNGGHAFVLDGYKIETLESGNKRTRFHVNWGWNGAYDGWFLLRKLQPKEDNYSNLNQRIVINIHPDKKDDIKNTIVTSSNVQKVLKDGQLIIERNNIQYTIQGQRIQ